MDEHPRQPPSRAKKKGFGLVRLFAVAAAAVALAKELRLPKDRRTWHGSVAGVVPYDFRRPTISRARQRFWSPDSPYIFTARVFGAGWTVNFGRLFALAKRKLQK